MKKIFFSFIFLFIISLAGCDELKDELKKEFDEVAADAVAEARKEIEEAASSYYDEAKESVKDYTASLWDSVLDKLKFWEKPPKEDNKNPSSWAQADVDRARLLGLLPASLDNNYKKNITREEFCDLATPLYEKIKGRFILSSLSFSDTSNQNVMHMASIGVIYGNVDGSFKPKNEISRQETAAVFSRLIEALGHPIAEAQSTFMDINQADEWAKGYIGKIQATGVMSGDDDHYFNPHDRFSREQSIVSLMRVWDLVEYLDFTPIPFTWNDPVLNFQYDQIPEREEHALTAWGMKFWKFKEFNIEHSGMIIEKWDYYYDVRDGSANIKFTIHNNNATAGELLLYDRYNTLVGRRIISAYVQNPTDLESYFRGGWELIVDTASFNFIFDQQRILSYSTDIEISIPRGGYIVIHNNTNNSDGLKMIYAMEQMGKVLNFASKGSDIVNQKNLHEILNKTVNGDDLVTLNEIVTKLADGGILSFLSPLDDGDVTIDTVAFTWSTLTQLTKETFASQDIILLLDKLNPDMGSSDTYISLVFGTTDKILMDYLDGTPAAIAINGMFMTTGGANFINAVCDFNNTLASGYVRIDNPW